MLTLTSSRYQARSHAVLAVDIVGSSCASDDLLEPMKTEMESLVAAALATVGLDWNGARHFRETGDGVMLAYPDDTAGQLVEIVFHLDHLLRSRNRYARMPMRVRVAVHIGPMADNARYHRTYITLTRLLTATRVADTVAHWCRKDPTGDKFSASLIMSSAVWRAVVEPFAVSLVPPARCARVGVVGQGFADDAWLHLPGLDAEQTLVSLDSERDGPVRAEPIRPNFTFGIPPWQSPLDGSPEHLRNGSSTAHSTEGRSA